MTSSHYFDALADRFESQAIESEILSDLELVGSAFERVVLQAYPVELAVETELSEGLVMMFG